MALEIAWFLTVLLLAPLTETRDSSTLWPYGKDKGDNYMDKTTVASSQGTPKSTIFYLDQNIKWFDGQDLARIKIFENGLISRSIYHRTTSCPQDVRKGYYVSAFWVPTDITRSGTVYYRQEKPSSSKSGLDYKALVTEISKGTEVLGHQDFYTGTDKKSNLKVEDIESIVVITWDKMVQPWSLFANPRHSNTFQMVLVSTKRGSYVHLVYAKIEYFHFVTFKFYCIRGGVTAITDGAYHFEMTKFFYLDASNLQIYTNIADYTRIGRYVMILRRITHQPSPPRLNCHTENASSFCKTGLPENFCQGLPTGRYKHPSLCSKFVLCNGDTTDVQDCGRRLVYNPWIQNCAWPHSYRCKDTDFPNMMKMFDTEMRRGRFNPLISIRYDRLNLRYSTHNNTCVGVPQWGNAVDASSCSNYLMCSNTRTFIMPCPPSHDGKKLFFNPETNSCDHQRNVKCENGRRPGDTPDDGEKKRPKIITPPPVTATRSIARLPSLPPNVIPCRGVTVGNVGDPFTCDHYYTCRHGEIITRFACPTSWNGQTLFYDSNKNQCVYREEIVCQPLSMTMPLMNGKD